MILYSRPRLFSLSEGWTAPLCNDGSANASSGCSVGTSDIGACGEGLTVGGSACFDGGTATGAFCAVGTTPGSSWNRCIDGGTPA